MNEQTISNASFLAYDETTEQSFGGRIDFNGGNTEEAFPDVFYFSNIEELSNTIKVLTDIYERAMSFRNKQLVQSNHFML